MIKKTFSLIFVQKAQGVYCSRKYTNSPFSTSLKVRHLLRPASQCGVTPSDLPQKGASGNRAYR